MNEVEAHENRLNALERDITLVSNQVHSLASSVAEVNVSVRTLGEQFGRMTDIIEQGRTPEWTTRDVIGLCAGALLTIAVGTISVFWGVSELIELRLNRSEVVIAELQGWMTDKDEFQREMHHEVGINKVTQDVHGSEIDKLWDHIHKLEEKDMEIEHEIADLGKKAAAAEVSRRAIGDYTKEHSQRPHVKIP